MEQLNEDLVISLKGKLRGRTADQGEAEFSIGGEMTLHIARFESGSPSVVLGRFGWYGMGAKAGKQHTGKISGMAQTGRGAVRLEKNGISFSVDTSAECTYEAIRTELGDELIGEHMTRIPPELFDFHIEGRLEASRSSKAKSRYNLKTFSIRMVYKEGGLGWMRTLESSQAAPKRIRRASSRPPAAFTVPGSCHPSLEVNRRTLTIQPVGFRSSNSDPSPTGHSLNTQVASASAVWGKCCIDFNVLPIHLITNAVLKTSGDASAIRSSFSSTAANVIEVFFVDNDLANFGGGVANSCGSAFGNVVMTDNNASNAQLFAHELGHILGFTHPGAAFGGCTEPDLNTVMVPTGGTSLPNSTLNTHWHCVTLANPALATSATACCLTHDVPDTIIKDYPGDAGVEPNSGFPGRNIYSMSNVWNRNSPDAGSVNADGTPQHQSPSRFESDGVTPHTNYLYAKVEALNRLRVRDGEVRFYLKHAAAGGSAANFRFLGAAPVSDDLAPGSPQRASLAWTIPAGTPTHSGILSVIHSPAEPAEDLTSFGFGEAEQLVRDDNDWAQRNHSIEQAFPNIGSGKAVEVTFPPIIIDYPLEAGLTPTRLSLLVQVGKARALRQLELSFPQYNKSTKLDRGANRRIQLDNSLRPGTQVLVIARAMINPHATTFGMREDLLGITPRLGNLDLVGYGFGVHINKVSEVIAQVMDRGLGALTDLGDLTGLASLGPMCGMIRGILREKCSSPSTVVQRFQARLANLEELQTDLQRVADRGYAFAHADVAFTKFFEAVAGDGDAVEVFEALRDLMNRLELVTWILYADLT